MSSHRTIPKVATMVTDTECATVATAATPRTTLRNRSKCSQSSSSSHPASLRHLDDETCERLGLDRSGLIRCDTCGTNILSPEHGIVAWLEPLHRIDAPWEDLPFPFLVAPRIFHSKAFSPIGGCNPWTEHLYRDAYFLRDFPMAEFTAPQGVTMLGRLLAGELLPVDECRFLMERLNIDPEQVLRCLQMLP